MNLIMVHAIGTKKVGFTKVFTIKHPASVEIAKDS